MATIPDNTVAVRGETKLEHQVHQASLPPISGTVMPLYGGGVQTGGMVEGSFPAPIREHRFPNSVWHQTATADPNAIGTWTPQGQFIQQIPTHQLDELRYTQYGVTSYHQATPVPGYQQSAFMQTNGSVYNGGSQQPQPSPHSLHNGTSRTTPTLNGGNMEYIDQSPQPGEFINNSYTHSNQDVMAPPTSSTPTSRCGSAQLEPNSEAKYTNPPTPTTPGNQGNAKPGYPLQMPPQSVQSLHNSSGYPGQENNTISNGKGELNQSVPKQQSQQDSWSVSNNERQRQNDSVQQQNSQSNDPWAKNNSVQQHNTQNHQNDWSKNSERQHQSNMQHEQNNVWPNSNNERLQTNNAEKIDSWSNNTNDEVQHDQQQELWSNRCDEGQQQLQQKNNTHQQNTDQQDMWNNIGNEPKHRSSNHQKCQQDMWTTQSENQNHNSNQQQQNSQQNVWLSSERQQHKNGMTEQNSHQEYWSNGVNGGLHKANSMHQQPQQQKQEIWSNSQNQQSWHTEKKELYPERAELNNRLKTMILNKQYQQESRRNEDTGQQRYQDQKNVENISSGNFLAQGHHPRNLVSEGGGDWDWGPQKFIKQESMSPGENCRKNIPTINYQQSNYRRKDEKTSKATVPSPGYYLPNKAKKPKETKACDQGVKAPVSQTYPNWCSMYNQKNDNQTIKQEPYWPCESENYSGIPMQTEEHCPRIPFGEDPRLEEPVEMFDPDKGTIEKSLAKYIFYGNGGPVSFTNTTGPWCCRQGGIDTPTQEHLKEGFCKGLQTQDELLDSEKELDKENENTDMSTKPTDMSTKDFLEHVNRLKNNLKAEVPSCDCFPDDQYPPEPGAYYSHLGAGASLPELRANVEDKTGFKGNALRIEKILYTGKEGKTTSGCPLAKWILRRSNIDEKLLIVVKNRQGHRCTTAWIVVVLVVWDGVPSNDADTIYSMLSHKLNKFGLPTKRKCETNEPRTCACQGLDPKTCGASFSFGCSWSMFYNGCKYARSKRVRKFRLSVMSEEQEVEDRLQNLATHVSLLYQRVAPESYKNQIQFDKEGKECRLGVKPGRPFSSVTACIDFCAHSHRDVQNMNNGCTVVVTLTKHRTLSKPEDEQLHVLPLYVMDETDEFGNRDAQLEKIRAGSIENLTRYPCEVRVRDIPLTPSRRKKRKEEEEEIHSPQSTTPYPPDKLSKVIKTEYQRYPQQNQYQTDQVPCVQMNDPFQSIHNSQYSNKDLYESSKTNNNNGWQKGNAWCCDLTNSPDIPGADRVSGRDSVNWFTREDRVSSNHMSLHNKFHNQQDLNSPPSTYKNFPILPNSEHSYVFSKGPPAYTQNGIATDKLRDLHSPYNTLANSVFRVPQGRPPSRPSNPATPHSPSEKSTPPVFLRPHIPQQTRMGNNGIEHNHEIQYNIPQSEILSPNTSNGYQYVSSDYRKSPLSSNENSRYYHHYLSSGLPNSSQPQLHSRMDQTVLMEKQEKRDHTVQYSINEKYEHPTHGNSYGRVPPPSPYSYNNSVSPNNPVSLSSSPLNPMSKETYTFNNYTNSWDKSPQSVDQKSNPSPGTLNQNFKQSGHESMYNNTENGYNTCLQRRHDELPKSEGSSINNSRSCTPSMIHNTGNIQENNYLKQLQSQRHPQKFGYGTPTNQAPFESNDRLTPKYLYTEESFPRGYHHVENNNLNRSRNYSVIESKWPPNYYTNTPVDNRLNQKEKSCDGCMNSSNEFRSAEYPNTIFSKESYSYGCQASNCFDKNVQSTASPGRPPNYQNHIMSQENVYPVEHDTRMYQNPTPYGHQVGGYQFQEWNHYGPSPFLPLVSEQTIPEPLGHVTDFIQNEEIFKDPQLGGVAIALGHGSVLFECAKHELHATTALRRPNREQPTRISLVFYQHRNLNRPCHGSIEWEEKMRIRKLGETPPPPPVTTPPITSEPPLIFQSPTYTTTTLTTLFPIYPCMVTGPYQESEGLNSKSDQLENFIDHRHNENNLLSTK